MNPKILGYSKSGKPIYEIAGGAPGIGASGVIGIAHETTYGTYVAPVKYFPITGESLQFSQATIWRRPVRGTADVVGGIPGNFHVNGDISFEVLEDVLPWFLYASRNTVTKAGAGADKTYTTTPLHTGTVASPTRSLSITVVKNGIVFGYVGCVVTQQSYTVDNMVLMATMSILGADEAVQSTPTASFPTTEPFGPGKWDLEIPTATDISDADTFTITINDNGDPQWRLRASRAAKFIKWGERDVRMTIDRDFDSRTDFDAFKALTAQSVTLKATKSATNYVHFKMASTIKNSYAVSSIGSQGDLIRSSVEYIGTYDTGTSKSYEIAVGTQEDIT